MNPARRYSAIAVLPAIAMLHRLGTWTARAELWSHLSELGVEADRLGGLYEAQHYVVAGFTLVGGALSVVMGPLPVLLLGLTLSAFAFGLMPEASAGGAEVLMMLQGAGSGIARPALWAAAVLPFGRPHEAGRNGLLALMWASMNVAAFCAPWISDRLTWVGNGDAGFVFAAVMSGTCAALAAPLCLLWLTTRTAAPGDGEPEPAYRLDWPVLGVACATIVLVAVPWGGLMSVWGPLSRHVYSAAPGSFGPEIWMGVNPVLVIWAAGLLAAVFLLLSLTRRNVPTLLLAGPGLVLLAVGVGMLSFEPVRTSVAGLGCGLVVMTLGEALAGPLLISRVVGDLHFRVVGMVMALWLVLTDVLRILGNADGPAQQLLESYPFAIAGGSAVLAVPLGIALAAVAIPLHRRLYLPDRPEERPHPKDCPGPEWQPLGG